MYWIGNWESRKKLAATDHQGLRMGPPIELTKDQKRYNKADRKNDLNYGLEIVDELIKNHQRDEAVIERIKYYDRAIKKLST
jgi:hypothetical protein